MRDSLAGLSAAVPRVPVAFLYGFTYQSKFYAFQTGYDSNMEAYSPGDIVFQMVYEHLVGEQMKESTICGVANPTKTSLGTCRRQTTSTLIFRCAGVAYLTQWLRVRAVRTCRTWMRDTDSHSETNVGSYEAHGSPERFQYTDALAAFLV